MNTVKRYLQQPSTWNGITLVLSSAGIAIAPGAVEIICAIGAGVIGLIQIFRDER